MFEIIGVKLVMYTHEHPIILPLRLEVLFFSLLLSLSQSLCHMCCAYILLTFLLSDYLSEVIDR